MSDALRSAGRRPGAEELLAHAGWLRALARGLVGDEHAAEDVVQETFAAAVQRPPREPGALRAWLGRVARNAAWKSIRGRRRRALRELAAARPEGASSGDETAERIEMQRALLDAVQGLDEPQRIVVVMRFYDGKAPRVIARELGLTPEVVWQRLSRALAVLRARLDDRYGRRDAWALVLLGPLGGRAQKSSVGAGAALVAGGALVGTKLGIASVAALALAAWWFWPRGDEAASPDPAAPAGDVAVAPEPETPKAPAPRATVPAQSTSVAPAESSRPRAKIRGRVVDAVDGSPIPNARVEGWRKSAGGGHRWKLVTGADGTFSGEVAEETQFNADVAWSAVTIEFRLEARARGHVALSGNEWKGPRGDDLGDVKLERGVVVRGRVESADGRPVAGAGVFVTGSARPLGYDFALQHARRRGESDEAGRFELDEALRPVSDEGLYTLLAAHADGIGYATLAARSGRDLVDDVVLVLRGAGASAEVVDAEGRPVPGAVVAAEPHFGPFRGKLEPGADQGRPDDPVLAAPFSRTTDADGRTRFDRLLVPENGTAVYDFFATAKGHAAGHVHGAPVPSPTESPVRIRLGVAVDLVAAGRVVDEDGAPVEGAAVRGAGVTPGLLTAKDGSFVAARVKGVPGTERLWVNVAKAGFAERPSVVVPLDAVGTPPTEIRLSRSAAIEGVVVDQDGEPVAGVRIMATRGVPPSGMSWVDSDANGRVSLTQATEGEWTLQVVPPKDGCRWRVVPRRTVQGGTRDLVVRLERVGKPVASVTVDLIDAESGAAVTADAAEFSEIQRDRTTRLSIEPRIEHGRVVISSVPAGHFALWLRVTGLPDQLVRIRVEEGTPTVKTTWRVRGPVTVAGRVRAPDDAPKDLRLTCSVADNPSVPGAAPWNPRTALKAAKTEPDGAFRIEGMTPSPYRIEVRDRGWIGFADVDASEGDVTVTVEVRRGAVLRVRGEGPVKASYVWVETSLDGGPWQFLAQIGPDEDGTFRSERSVRPGRLRWRASFHQWANEAEVAPLPAPQEGEVLAEAGAEVEIVVPVRDP